jgi:hypothetical protein
MNLTHLSTRALLAAAGAVAALAVGASAQAASLAPSLCPAGGALVSYASAGARGARTVVVQHDGRVWLCWSGLNGIGRTAFVLGKRDLAALRTELRLIGIGHLTPAVRPSDPPSLTSLSYRGMTFPLAGRRPTIAGAAALERAELMLDLVAEQRIAGR